MIDSRLFQTITILSCTWAAMGCGQSQEVQNLKRNRQQQQQQPLVCSTLDRDACHSEDQCVATYEPIDCIQGPCPEVSYSACQDAPDPSTCSPVLCEMYCPFGFAADATGCEICSCAPAFGDCETMDELQCNSAPDCRAHYLPQSQPGSSGSSGSSGSRTRPPCEESILIANQNRHLYPEPHPETFVGCSERFEPAECSSNSDCPSGYCSFSRDQGDDPTGSGARPDPQPAIGYCIDFDCSDGTALICDAPQPLCEPGSIATIRNGCWACVAEDSCAEPICAEPANTRRAYISRDDDVCAQVGPEFSCGGDSAFFSDACGCGCEVEEPLHCPPASEEIQYISQDPEECAMIDFQCEDDNFAFSNECGCGCISADRPIEPPPQRVVDCSEGTEASATLNRVNVPQEEYSRFVTVAGRVLPGRMLSTLPRQSRTVSVFAQETSTGLTER